MKIERNDFQYIFAEKRVFGVRNNHNTRLVDQVEHPDEKFWLEIW